MIDSIADLIVRIKNAGLAYKQTVVISYSKMKLAIAELLKREGFVKEVEKKGKKITKFIEITLAYESGKPKIQDIVRISKFSRRIYQGVKDIKSVRQGFGRLVLTTPKGILTDKEARAQKVGGESLFKIW